MYCVSTMVVPQYAVAELDKLNLNQNVWEYLREMKQAI